MRDSQRAIPATMRRMSFPLSAQRIAAYRTQTTKQAGALSMPEIGIEVVAETGSTNADLLARLPRLQGPLLLIAERQTAGRGRAGRAWHSEPGSVLTFSLAWRFDRPLHTLTGLPLAVGVALAETLAALAVPVSLKWPNDVLKEGCKLAGILIETAKADSASSSWAVIGIGLNLKLPASLAADIGQPAASLALPEMDANVLLGKIASALTEALAQFEQQGLSAFVVRWNRWHAHAGQAVCILDNEQILHEGRALGIADNGALLLETAGGVISVMSGDVSLRAKTDGKESKHAVTG
jgi:BirA family biotin operon repressor/biotin-[acetyl-CoA-carboxylase] ligase